MLKHHADLATHGVDMFQVTGQLDPIDNNAALLVFLQAVDTTDHSRFA